MPKQADEGVRFLSYLTLGLLAASLYIFSSYLHYILVAAVLALCTSHGLSALVHSFGRPSLPSFIKKQKLFISSTILTLFFLCLIFAPLVYFISETYTQMQGVDIDHVKQITMQMVEKVVSFTDSIPIVHNFLDSLKDEGFSTLEDLHGLEQGYASKIFHTIAHLLDGFIGIDSHFYNLEEDSHGISPDLEQKILAAPDNYWILRVKGRIASANEDPLHALRTFEWKGKGNN